jgi:hypothetical protein
MVAGKKTLLRTIRITQDLEDLLQKDAKLKRISVNALISSIMTKYAEWDRYRERFTAITLNPRGFSFFLDSVNDEKIEAVARQVGSALSREFILFVSKKINLETYLSHLSLLCQYGGFAHLEIENEGSDYTITLLHTLGQKWSNYLMNLVDESMKTDLSIVPRFDVKKNAVVIRFRSHR